MEHFVKRGARGALAPPKFEVLLTPSITDGIHRNENLVDIIPVFSTFSNFFKKKKNII